MTEKGLGAHWRKVRLVILRRDRYRCHWCGGRANTVDHLVPRAEGGARYDPRNLVASCAPCNFRRGAELLNRRRGTSAAGLSQKPRRVWAGAITIEP